MRTFYIFKIKREFSILTKDTPYNLFRMIENLYYMDTLDMGASFKVYHDIFDYFDPLYLNKRVYNLFKDNRFYEGRENYHAIHNKYTKENTTLKIYKSHLLLKSDVIRPTLLVNYLMSDNLFVCDFKNKDYFWLNELVR